MAKQGMKRPDIGNHKKNDVPPVPEIQGPAKYGNKKVSNITNDTFQNKHNKQSDER